MLVGLSECVAARRGVVYADRMITVLERHPALERCTNLACTFCITLFAVSEDARKDFSHVIENLRVCSAPA